MWITLEYFLKDFLKNSSEDEFVKAITMVVEELSSEGQLFRVSFSWRKVLDQTTDLPQEIEQILKDFTAYFEFFSLVCFESTNSRLGTGEIARR